MTSLYIFIGLIAFFFIALTLSNKLQRKKGNTKERETPVPPIDVTRGGCCGMHETCKKAKQQVVSAVEVEYFDDEALDRFRDRNANSYSAEEVEEFREVFYTVLNKEKRDWLRSLCLRKIAIPSQMYDEVRPYLSEKETIVHPS